MPRRSVLALTAVAVLVLAGCGRPAGVDGNLMNGWPSMPEPKLPVPTAPACYFVSLLDDPADVTRWPAPSPCTVAHNDETVYVGQFTSPDAERTSPPPSGGSAVRAAYAECSKPARDYLGDDWRVSRLRLYLVVPSASHWEAGARTYRCDVGDTGTAQSNHLELLNASVKGALAGPTPLRLGCFVDSSTDGTSAHLAPVACTEGHNAEFAGVADLPDGPYPAAADLDKASDIGCLPLIAAYAGLPNDADMKYRTGLIYQVFSADEWSLGNRGMRCYLWTDTKTLTASMKGAGTKAFPVR